MSKLSNGASTYNPKACRWKPGGFFYKKPTGFLLSLVIVMLSTGIALGQERTITLMSSTDRQPVQDAYVKITELNSKVNVISSTDRKGKVTVPFESTVAVDISHVGFLEIKDTLEGNISQTYQLIPLSVPLDEVVVTAQYTPDDPRNSVHQVKVIKKDQLEKQGANNLRELLTQQSNIRIYQDNVLGSSLSMQGLSGEQIKILEDGVPVIGRTNGNIDISQINLNNAKRIEVIEGPMSVQYGTNALGGVINVITEDAPKEKFRASINGYYESVGVYNADGNIGFSKGKHSLDVSGGRYFFGGYSDKDTSRHKQWKPKEQYFGDLKYTYSFKRLHLITKGSAFYEKITNRGEPRAPYFINAFDDHYLTSRYNGSLILKGEILENHYLHQDFSYSYYSRIKNTYYKDLVSLSEVMTPNPSDQDTSKFDAFHVKGFISRNKPFKIFNYQVGYDINVERGKGQRIEQGQQMIGDYAFFGSFNIKPVTMFTLQAGIRWSYNTNYKAPVTPSLNVKLKPLEDLVIRLSYARGFRAPSLKELYFYFVDVNHNIRGNQDLKAEKSHNASLYIDFSKSLNKHRIKVIPSFFFNDISNMISLAETGSNTEYSYINIDNYQTIGGQLNFDYTFSDLKINVGGGYTGRKNNMASDTYSFTPEASVEASYMIPKALLTVSVFNKYNGEITGFYLNETGEVQEQKIAAYNLLDLSVNRRFWNDRLILTFGAKNLLDVNNIKTAGGLGGAHSSGSTSAPVAWGRTFFASLKFNYWKK